MNVNDITSPLRQILPEFQIRILAPRTIDPGLLNIEAGSKIAIELPRENTALRITLLRELGDRTGLSFHSDSRALDAACIEIDESGHALRGLKQAIDTGKLDGLSISHLDEQATTKDRDFSLGQRKAAGIAPVFVALAHARLGKPDVTG